MHLDLHVHSTASDGSLSAEDIVHTADSLGLAAISITDHDSVASIEPALDAARELSVLVVPGVELSAVHDGRDVHILGYFVNHTDLHFLDTLSRLRDARLERATIIVNGLADAGYDVSLQDVLLLAEGASVGRSHVARALVDRGHADSVGDAFERFVGRGKPYYVPKPVAEPASVIETIVRAGGVPVLAHPGITRIDAAIADLVGWGLVGLEAYHADHDPADRQRYARLAEELGLIVTGGSDFHGPLAPGAAIGAVEVPDDVLERLQAASRR